ncbi:toll/interleukin-1 receptor domain-containing protein [Pseudomonas fluorescens]|uniref:TIR domain-containing protein n=1 Tax=Pseudomonas fluorescens TaxID=294 RepID=A0A7Z3GZV3_PSEFL|nr:TIR domain-containing protein [Pseudomonas fluorescens]QJP95500.1 hypothetical protein C6Y56_13200 [Pseudomonas fluorescens]
MSQKMIFLSHIHEEKALALIIQQAIVEEFSGFVDVFVSSDGTSIPAGANFLKKIENGLTNCVAAIYLISNTSVKRNWINFELGAIWIRNLININEEKNEIPLLPICHSGASPSTLPSPLNNLNAISGNQASQLEFAFKSLQSAVGGRGKLKTDFNKLAEKLIDFEYTHNLGANIATAIKLLLPAKELKGLIESCERLDPTRQELCLKLENIENSIIKKVRAMANNELHSIIRIESISSGFGFGPNGSVSMESINMYLSPKLIVDAKKLILDI